MSKLDNVKIRDERNNKELTIEELESIKKEERKKRISGLYLKLSKKPENLTIEELKELKKLERLPFEVKLDFTDDGYFIIKRSVNLTKSLSLYTRGLIYTIAQMITYEDGRLTYENNKLIKGFEDLKEYLEISNKIWSKYIKPDIDKYNIISKQKNRKEWCLLLNPIFSTKNRKISETMFVAFHKELKEHISPIDYLYLKKLYGIEI